jgi:Family of unknown function (DUF6361)
MPSMIAWLDASREDQRRMREIVNLFTQSESRDELGIGQVRDAFSDSLFPGTSTLHTRARYLLFVPWCFVAAAAKGGTAARGERRVEDNERALIAGLRDLGATDGLIGRVAGVAVKTLPSTLYWGALRQYAIVQVAEPLDVLGRRVSPDPDQEELAERVLGAWSPTLPPVPAGFPRHPKTGFELSRTEAGWLQERMLGGTEGSLLHHLASDGNRPQANSDAPWDDPICHTSSPEVKRILEHARLFSLAVHGASYLYNLMIAERYVKAGHTKIENPVERYRDLLQEWAQECEKNDGELSAWDRSAFWDLILAVNPQVRPVTRAFLSTWFDRVCSLDIHRAADDEALRQLIARRERTQKGSQSRLTNDRLLAAWSGQSGTRRLTYRWDQVNRIIRDLHDGLEAARATS